MKKTKELLILGTSMLVLSTASLAAEDTPNIKFGGRIQADNTDFQNDKYAYTDGSELRRARLFVSGDLSENWDYKVQVDFAPVNSELKDVYLRYNGFENSRISIGNFKQFSSLEELTSSNNTTFTERSLPNALVTSRRMGIGFQNWSERYSIAVSAYGNEANNLSQGKGYAGRFVYRPTLAGDQLLHLGLALATEEVDKETMRLRARPESHQDSHRIVDSGNIQGIKNFNKIGLEAAYVNGRFSAQSEFVRQNLQRRVGSNLSFDGYYAYASYFLTDDSRPYSTSDASFGTVSPTSEKGAWEIAARISNLDLNDGDITGGATDILTLGVNYYMTRNLRFTANYIMADSDAVAGNDDPNALQLRMRFTF
jgi:phosphate-selective porin OprO and OprP